MTDRTDITCRINGKDEILPEGTTLVGFLEMKKVPPKAVVVEHNKMVLKRGTYDGIILSDGDVLEIIQVIGGG